MSTNSDHKTLVALSLHNSRQHGKHKHKSVNTRYGAKGYCVKVDVKTPRGVAFINKI